MDTKLLLVKAITLVYLSTLVKEISDDVHNIVSRVLTVVKPPEHNSVRAELTHDVTASLRELLVRLVDESKVTKFNEDDLRQRYLLVTDNESSLYRALNGALMDGEEDQEKIRERAKSEYWAVRRILDQEEIAKITREWSFRLAYNPESINWTTIVDEMTESYRPFVSFNDNNKGIEDHPAVIATIDFDNVDGVEQIMHKAKEELSEAGVLKTPYQGINRMCGEPGGFRRGEALLVGALRHQYKSGFSRDLFIGIPLVNKPYMMNPDKTPLNLRISLEDDPNTDIMEIYKRIRHYYDKVNDRVKNIDPSEAARYIQQKLGVNGYSNIIVSADPTSFGVEDIINTIDKLEREGYEIHHLNVDYLAMSAKNASRSADSNSQFIQNMFTKLRNVCRRKKIFLSTPHQLGPEAKQLLKEGVSDFVKHVVGKSFYDGCRRIDQEVDMEITVHIEVVNDEKYCTVQRGKHRGVNNTPISHQYCAYKFDRELGLPYDWEGDDLSYRKIGGSTMSDGGAGPLWDVD